jgi:hypothetical protein
MKTKTVIDVGLVFHQVGGRKLQFKGDLKDILKRLRFLLDLWDFYGFTQNSLDSHADVTDATDATQSNSGDRPEHEQLSLFDSETINQLRKVYL